MGEGTEGNFRTASIFFCFALFFPGRNVFGKTLAHPWKKKKLKQEFYRATLLARE